MDIILKYFTDLTTQQEDQLGALFDLYKDWNAKINVVSRKDIDHLYLHHVLHSMSICKWIKFKDGTKVLDVGCGGGFPGIPLAIMYPEVDFHLVDSIRKKLTVVNEVAEAIKLKNVRTTHARVEETKGKYDFIITRAVAKLPVLLSWTGNKISSKHINAIPNGLVALKGGDLRAEIKPVRKKEYVEQISIGDYYDEPFFDEKFIVYVQG